MYNIKKKKQTWINITLIPTHNISLIIYFFFFIFITLYASYALQIILKKLIHYFANILGDRFNWWYNLQLWVIVYNHIWTESSYQRRRYTQTSSGSRLERAPNILSQTFELSLTRWIFISKSLKEVSTSSRRNNELHIV